jgi:hypothetical protein
MLPNLRAYHRPTTLDEAVRLIRPPAVVPLGGGTVLLPARDPAVEEVVDLSGLGLTYIRAGEDGIRIGATTPLQHLLESPPLADLTGSHIGPVLRLTASRNLRGQATVGGTVASGGPENPFLVLLLALDAGLTVYQPEASLSLAGGVSGGPRHPSAAGSPDRRVVHPDPPCALRTGVCPCGPHAPGPAHRLRGGVPAPGRGGLSGGSAGPGRGGGATPARPGRGGVPPGPPADAGEHPGGRQPGRRSPESSRRFSRQQRIPPGHGGGPGPPGIIAGRGPVGATLAVGQVVGATLAVTPNGARGRGKPCYSGYPPGQVVGASLAVAPPCGCPRWGRGTAPTQRE